MGEAILVLSDIHSNLSALEATLEDAEKYGPFAAKLFGGDAVGYGPDPVPVIRKVIGEGFISVRGNHDRAVTTGVAEGFKQISWDAARYNRHLISKNKHAMEFLEGLSNTPYIDPKRRFEMVHGSPAGFAVARGLVQRYFEDIYVHDREEIADAVRTMEKQIPLCIICHTHVPLYVNCWINTSKEYSYDKPLRGIRMRGSRFQIKYPIDEIIEVESRKQPKAPSNYQGENPWVNKILINPGSVGQPRDGDPRAAYAILRYGDDGRLTIEYRRVAYNISKTQMKMAEIGMTAEHGGFDPMLIKRLVWGR